MKNFLRTIVMAGAISAAAILSGCAGTGGDGQVPTGGAESADRAHSQPTASESSKGGGADFGYLGFGRVTGREWSKVGGVEFREYSEGSCAESCAFVVAEPGADNALSQLYGVSAGFENACTENRSTKGLYGKAISVNRVKNLGESLVQYRVNFTAGLTPAYLVPVSSGSELCLDKPNLNRPQAVSIR